MNLTIKITGPDEQRCQQHIDELKRKFLSTLARSDFELDSLKTSRRASNYIAVYTYAHDSQYKVELEMPLALPRKRKEKTE